MIRQRRPPQSSASVSSQSLKPTRNRIKSTQIPRRVPIAIFLPDRIDFFLIFLFFLTALFIRFYRLEYPCAVVFDEFHFGKFIDWILKQEHYFDIHPPLGKLTLAFIGSIFGYKPKDGFLYDSIGASLEGTQYIILRRISACFGSLIVPLGYILARELGISKVSSVLTSWCFLFDTMLIIESRLILIDSQLLVYCLISFWCALRLWKTEKHSKIRFFWILLTASFGSLALSIKWTALAYPGLIAMESFFGLFLLNDDQLLSISECMTAAISAALMYMFWFYIHFQNTVKSGTGDGFMPSSYTSTLLHENPNSTGEWIRDSEEYRWFLTNFLEVNAQMYISNKNLETRHNWESQWYQWILNWRGVLYFTNYGLIDKETGFRQDEKIYLIGNPAVLWSCFVSIVLFILWILYSLRYRHNNDNQNKQNDYQKYRIGMILFVGYILNLLPYILVDRSAFIYHYLPGLVFAELLLTFMMDLLPKYVKFSGIGLLLTLIFMAFLYWAPWIYAIRLGADQHAHREWLPRWN